MNPFEFQTTWGAITLTLDGSGKAVALDLPPLKTTPRKEFAVLGFQGLENPPRPDGHPSAGGDSAQTFFQTLEKKFPLRHGSEQAAIGAPDGTEFQMAVWNEIKKIPRGQTRTYGEIAAAIGRPKAVRAVGSACGANPLPVFIPCHRVVAANGPGGFGSGLPWKKLLLELEKSPAGDGRAK